MENNITTIARINGVNIQIIENGQKMVPIKPICQALGISHQAQIDRLKEDPILSSTVMLSMTVGADGKDREMTAIPLRFVFGWLFRIDSRNVKEEAREAVMNYQLECYNALYNYFAQMEEFLRWKQQIVEDRLKIYDEVRIEFREAKERVQEARDRLNEVRKVTFDDYHSNKNQLVLDFSNEAGKEESNE